MTSPPETPGRIEPCLLESISPEVADLIAALTAEAKKLEAGLPPRTAAGLADYVRIMNCYYSNLIEGHKTVPRHIQWALEQREKEDGENDLSHLPSTAVIERALGRDSPPLPPEERGRRRDLLFEARAHVRVQETIDRNYAVGILPEMASAEFLCELHRLFYEGATKEMLTIRGAGRSFLMTPGEFRSSPMHDNAVGRHQPPSSGAVGDFMAHFAKRYAFANLGPAQRLIAMAAGHHRLNYIHPFPDGNGRVSRLMSHAMGLAAGIGANGLWSVSRGLARGLGDRGEYKRMMDHADSPRQFDRDGRGNLSHKALEEFIVWFLRVCLDQVSFMASLFEIGALEARLEDYARSRSWPREAVYLLHDVLRRGEMPRGDAARVSGMAERTARNILSALVEDGILASDTPKGPVHLNVSATAAEVLFPRLNPEMQG